MITKIEKGRYRAECDWLECGVVEEFKAAFANDSWFKLSHRGWRKGKGSASNKSFCPKHSRPRSKR